MKDTEFERRLNSYVNYINDNFVMDNIEGNFLIVHAYMNKKEDIFNRLSFSEHYFLNQVQDYCQNILPLLWEFEYCQRNIKVTVYNCYLNPETSKVSFKVFGQGYYKESNFVYNQL